ncbi:MAG: AraC family transcriptional regulator [Candidatus Devosia phytovorans]|uniref:AraC family transcriptional regulator n=1 Tax=Candidatus Devosia phytovorans TaxID=3121372 RepID=A0AAJ5VYQ2_9HYPH|nr:AraC family transcriptional regulator [Devosia sp.]WEK05882.1 MAG: AraC family transcriptional regulator [Devosia sp.]
MKSYLEHLTPDDDASWATLDRQLDDGIPFHWHHHPEFELTLTLNSSGQRFIGDHIGRYEPGDLVLIGPYLPHTWHSLDRPDASRPHNALVMWFLPEWAERLTANAELRPVAILLARAANGIKFSDAAASAVRPAVEQLFTLPPVERFLGLVSILSTLAGDRHSSVLSATAPELAPASTNRGRIDRVLDHIHANFSGPVAIAELANIAALSPSGLHRTFLRHTRQTVSQYLIRLRIGRACALLSSDTMPIGQIAGAVGYDSLANFNRQFKTLKGTTPRAYRKAFAA